LKCFLRLAKRERGGFVQMVVIVESKKEHIDMKLNTTDQTFELELPILQAGIVKIGAKYSNSR